MTNSGPHAEKKAEARAPILPDQAGRDAALDTTRSFLVQAPAGSGKTELLIRRFLKLLGEVDEPEQVLAITFTRAATAEMRARVLDALEQAARFPETQCGDPLPMAASAALKNAAARDWKLLEQPHRLNIQTIDSLCLNIASRTPLLSRLGGELNPTEHAEPLYALAARRTLARLGGDRDDLSQAIRALLETRDTNLGDCERLISSMLARRDGWGPVLSPVGESSWQEVRSRLEAPFRQERRRGIAQARNLLARDAGIGDELMQLAAYARSNLENQDSLGNWLLPLQGINRIEELEEQEHWDCVCDFLLTSGKSWRKKVDKNLGFPRGSDEQKQRFEKMLAELQKVPGALLLLLQMRDLPPAGYSSEQWRLLEKILLILRYAAAELRVLFAERGEIDFVELGLAARQALRGDPEDPDAALPPALNWRHLLVDEFQDTSRAQYDLFQLLVGQRDPSEPGTCFLVGDPMQSIYGFRQAEVELFERTRRYGLGNGLHLEFIVLQTNFRSHAGLVESLNRIFEDIFTKPVTGLYEVAFAPSAAIKPAPEGVASVQIVPQFLSSKPTREEKEAGEEAEAEETVRAIQRARTSFPDPGQVHIAVLVRAKRHLMRIAQKLREAEIPYRAVEIENLDERQEILDLTALTRALLQPMDRIAWLSVLRAPWCGLTLQDLHTLCGSDDPELRKTPLLSLLRQRIGLFSPDGQRRATRALAVLEQGLRGKYRQVSFSAWVERVWRSLGGRECVGLAGYENARAFFRMLEGLPPDGAGLERMLDRLFAEPDPRTNERSGVQLMTIHKAKGLGFDVVLVPGLHRGIERHDQPLLNWLERTALESGEEREGREFLVAPIGRKDGEKDPLYSWITKQKKRREREESKRLLYVACTRAKEKLHLLGTAKVKTQDAGGEPLAAGVNGSLLHTAWPALEQVFRARREQASVPAQSAAPPLAPTSPPSPAPTRKVLQLRRLPPDWKPFARPEETFTVLIPPEESWGPAFAPFERPGGSLQARALGQVVHALLEEVAVSRLSNSAADLFRQVEGWRPRAAVLLRQAGLARAEAEAQSAKAVQALKSALDDETGRWILGPHAAAESETSWSMWTGSGETGESLRTLRGDRIFRAGAEPLSREETHIWIVDYKTAHHGGQGLEAFLVKEREKYQRQLESYGNAMREAHGDQFPLRLALYYPLLKKFLWWEG